MRADAAEALKNFGLALNGGIPEQSNIPGPSAGRLASFTDEHERKWSDNDWLRELRGSVSFGSLVTFEAQSLPFRYASDRYQIAGPQRTSKGAMNGVNLMNKALKSFGGDEPNPTMPATY